MNKNKIPNVSELLESDGPVCVVLSATLRPVGETDRFQPAGFPEVGHVIYDAPRFKDGKTTREKVCIVDSSASMANHLESVCMAGAGTLDLAPALSGMPFVVCETDAGVEIANGTVSSKEDSRMDVVSTLTEGHRLASDYFLDAKADANGAETFREMLRKEFKIVEVQRDKTYFIPPGTWWDIFKTIFKYDPNSLVHGVLFAKEQIKISRVLASHLEAFGASRVGSAGVKFDRLQKTTSGQPIFAIDEETAERIQATFIIDLGLLRSFGREKNGLSQKQKELILSLALWKVGQLLLRPFRYRSNCFLKTERLALAIDGEKLQLNTDDTDTSAQKDKNHCDEQTTAALINWLRSINIAEAITASGFPQGQPTRVYYPANKLFKAGKEEANSTDPDKIGDENEEGEGQ